MNRVGKLFVAAAIAVVPMACKDDIRKEADKAAEDVKDQREDVSEQTKELNKAVEEQREDTRELDEAQRDKGTLSGLPENVNEREVKANTEEVAEQTKDVAKQSEELREAEYTFDVKRTNRVAQLRAEHQVVATQPMLINSLGAATALTDRARADLAEKLTLFQMRLDEAGNAIEGLQTTDAAAFESKNDDAAKAMERLEDARDNAWEALNDGDRIEPS
jgi:hypothetical protein